MAAAVVVGALLTGCSKVQPRLHVDTIQQAIVTASKIEFKGARLGKAHCPSGRLQRKGDTFTCTLSIDGQVAHFLVRQADSHGTIDKRTPALQDKFVLVRDVDTAVVQEVRNVELLDVQAQCGSGVVFILRAARTVRCTATYGPKIVRHVTVVLSAAAQVGAVHFVEALLSTFKVGGEISNALSMARGHIVYVECGDRQAVIAVGATLHCDGADGLGAPLFPITVTVKDTSGNYAYTPTK
jgi:hypothetical protein